MNLENFLEVNLKFNLCDVYKPKKVSNIINTATKIITHTIGDNNPKTKPNILIGFDFIVVIKLSIVNFTIIQYLIVL